MTTKTFLLQTIRKNCLDCCGGSWLDVENCTSSKTCVLFPFRFGSDPEGGSPARQEQGRKLQESRKIRA